MKSILFRKSLYRPMFVLLTSLVILVLLTSCSGLSLAAPTETPLPTSTSTATAEPTATATSTATPTPEPTATSTATPTPDVTGTAVAAATETVDAFLKELEHDLGHYNLTLDSGYLAYYGEDPISFKLKSYMEEQSEALKGLPPMGDFLLQSEIKWDSSSGLAGCGLIFRAEEDLKKGAQYQFYMMRLQNAPGWVVEYYKDGRAQYAMTLDQRFQFTNLILDGKQSTNKVAILAKGDQYTIFINGETMRPLTNNKLATGILGVIGWQESGTTTCEFENTWVWSFDEP